MSYTDSPEFIASRLSSEIRSSESNTRSCMTDVESRLGRRIHDLEMSLIRKDRNDFIMFSLGLAFIAFIMMICLAGHSRESNNTGPTSQATRPEVSTPQAASTPEEGK